MATQLMAHYGELAAPLLVDQDDHPAHVTVFSAPLPLSEEDLTAALYRGMVGEHSDLLEDRAVVREIVADQVVNAGMTELDDQRHYSKAFRPGTFEYGMWQACRAAVGLAFAPALVPAQRAALAGVS